MLFKNLEEALKFAVKQEEMVIKLYKRLCKVASNEKSKKLFLDLVDIEIEHRDNLKNYSWAKCGSKALNSVYFDLELSDYEIENDLENLTYLEILLNAAKREKLAIDMYTKLSDVYKSSPQVHNFFYQMISEEERHKYDLDLMILEHREELIDKMKFKDIT